MAGYNYEEQKPFIFTDAGQRMFLKVRDQAAVLFQTAGAFTIKACTDGIGSDTWKQLACVDRLIELGEYRKISTEGLTQYHVLGK